MNQKIERNIFLYKFFIIFSSCGFIAPVWMLFCAKTLNLSWTQIFLIEAVSFFIAFLAEIPFGALADLIGRKKMLILGCFLKLIGAIIGFYSWNAGSWFIANTLMVLSIPSFSGADTALLYDSMKHLKKETEFKKTQGIIESIRFISLTVFCMFASTIMYFDLRICFLADAVCSILTLITLSKVIEPPLETKVNKKIFNQMHESWIICKNSPLIMNLILFSTMLFMHSSIIFYVPYFIKTNLPIWCYGFAYAIFNLVACITARNIEYLEKTFGEKHLLSIMMLGKILTWLLMIFFNPTLGFLFISFEQVSRGLHKPVIEHIIHKNVPSSHRASSISMHSFVQTGSRMITLLFAGMMIDNIQLSVSISIFLIICSIGMLISIKRIKNI